MATLNLNEKKIPSAENLRLLSSLILSLSSKQGAIENKLINNWVASTAYIKDESFVIYDELLYVCKISNADDTFDKNKWTCLSPVIEELTKADIEALVSLTPEQITNLQSLIDDTSISTTHTNSSSHIYMDIQAAIAECKDDTLKQIAKKVSGSYKIAASTSEVTSADFIYLISNGANYDLYVLVDSVPTKIGDSSIDLTDFYTKTEVDNDFLKKTDATSTYATITTVDGKVDKTDIVDNLTSTDTDKPLSANQGKVLKDEVDLKANDSDVVKKTDITTTIDKTSTDDKIPTAKAIYNKSKNKISEVLSGGDIIAYADAISNETITDTVRMMNATNSPYGVNQTNNDFYYTIYNIITDYNFKRIVAYDIRENDMYMIMKNTGVWGTWKRVCTTSVADVPFTKLTLDSSVFTSVDNSTYISYSVRNGICTITCKGVGLVSPGVYFATRDIPHPVGGYVTNILQLRYEDTVPTKPVFLSVEDGALRIYSQSSTGPFWGTLTYRVAES